MCLVSSAASAQQKARKTRSTSSTICKLASVPKGMVIVGYKANRACGEAMELVVKRPDTAEIICTDSPVPDGFMVGGVQGSATCNTGNSNPMSNALAIWSDDATSAPPRESVSPGYSSQPVRRSSSSQSKVIEERAKQLNIAALREGASRSGSIMIGMTMDQVRAAFGPPNDASRTTRAGSGRTTTWTYKGEGQVIYVYFDDDNLVEHFVKSEY